MDEEKTDINAPLTDEAIGEATGGTDDGGYTVEFEIRSHTCERCQHVYTYRAPKGMNGVVPTCPSCGFCPRAIPFIL